MLAPNPSQHLESEIPDLGNPFAMSAKPDPALAPTCIRAPSTRETPVQYDPYLQALSRSCTLPRCTGEREVRAEVFCGSSIALPGRENIASSQRLSLEVRNVVNTGLRGYEARTRAPPVSAEPRLVDRDDAVARGRLKTRHVT
jgi:hypothetical protein